MNLPNASSSGVNVTGWTCSVCGRFVLSTDPAHYCGGGVGLNNLPPVTYVPITWYPSGWLCPRCSAVNAPTVLRCSCSAQAAGACGP